MNLSRCILKPACDNLKSQTPTTPRFRTSHVQKCTCWVGAWGPPFLSTQTPSFVHQHQADHIVYHPQHLFWVMEYTVAPGQSRNLKLTWQDRVDWGQGWGGGHTAFSFFDFFRFFFFSFWLLEKPAYCPPQLFPLKKQPPFSKCLTPGSVWAWTSLSPSASQFSHNTCAERRILSEIENPVRAV